MTFPFPFFSYTAGVPMMAARFDGTDGISIAGGIGGGITDGSDFLVSFWIKFNGGDSSLHTVLKTRNSNPSTGVQIVRDSSNNWRVLYFTNTGSLIGDATSSSTWTTSSGWHHVLFFRTANQNAARLYINGTQEASLSASGTSVEWTVSNVYFGRDETDSGRLNADIADFLLYRAPLPDLTNATNREPFYSSTGKPVYPGDSGELPIASNSPFIYLSANASSFQTNLGLGSNFTVNAGDSLDYVDSGLRYA